MWPFKKKVPEYTKPIEKQNPPDPQPEPKKFEEVKYDIPISIGLFEITFDDNATTEAVAYTNLVCERQSVNLGPLELKHYDSKSMKKYIKDYDSYHFNDYSIESVLTGINYAPYHNSYDDPSSSHNFINVENIEGERVTIDRSKVKMVRLVEKVTYDKMVGAINYIRVIK